VKFVRVGALKSMHPAPDHSIGNPKIIRVLNETFGGSGQFLRKRKWDVAMFWGW